MLNHGVLGLVLVPLCLCGTAAAAPGQTPPAADRWLTNSAPHPALRAGTPDSDSFTNLQAQVLGGQLTVSWAPSDPADPHLPSGMTLHASAADISHWPVRDWRTFPMNRSGRVLQADVPSEDLDVPIVYYARLATPDSERVSPLRVLHPRRLGLEEPTRVFWPFLEGFEDGFTSWRLLAEEPGLRSLQTSSEAKNGRASLTVSLPSDALTVRVATTRVRGWQLVQEGATGLRLWLRTQAGPGEVRCSLQARSATTNLVAGQWVNPFPVTNRWRKIDLLFADLPILPWRSVDLFVLEFRAAPPAELLVDDLQFLGPWRLDSGGLGER